MTDSLEGQRRLADYLKGEMPLNKTQRRQRREKQARKLRRLPAEEPIKPTGKDEPQP